MKFLLGTKVNMTQIFDEKGIVHPATVIKTGPMVVTQVKTVETDGYSAVQVGFGTRNAKNINKALKGHMKEGNFATLVEFRMDDVSAYKVGDTVPVTFAAGDVVTTTSISKGKGFQGAVKRHGFKGGPRSHGQKHSEREVGSIGGGGRDGGRVAKGKRMAGRMGGDTITSKGLTVVGVNPEANEVYVRGAISGRRGTLVEIVG
ncbi:MAG: ribosomal protein L3 [Parcubacteria bacterium C7867-003]|nr:MAG: ribosomal protein L3 [Parcubacteria bacterium C7867-003]